MHKIKTNKQLGEARNAVQKAQSELHALVQELWPVGAKITWLVRSYQNFERTVNGTVVSHGYGDRIKVRRNDTGKTYWIDERRIVC